jgi:hypothetical protein
MGESDVGGAHPPPAHETVQLELNHTALAGQHTPLCGTNEMKLQVFRRPNALDRQETR